MPLYLNGFLEVVQDDITAINIDVIVNAANSSLMGGGGVDGAIHRIGGTAILQACREIRDTQYPGGLPTGQVVATTAGDLSALYVFHTVGPVWQGGSHHEDQLLTDCYRNSLLLAQRLNVKSIAFPAISTGVYGYPFERSVELTSHVIEECSLQPGSLEQVLLVFYSREDYQEFLSRTPLRPIDML